MGGTRSWRRGRAEPPAARAVAAGLGRGASRYDGSVSEGQIEQGGREPVRLRRMLKSKIHRIAVTEANLHYNGSLTLDRALLDAADLYEYEQIDVVNVNNGARFSTYLIEGGPGTCCLNGAAARLGQPGDLLILMAYDLLDEQSAAGHKPTVIVVDGENRRVAEG